jgi:type I restriction-modification system DNA methylase subunit
MHVLWIDEEMMEETLEAKRQGKTFEEVNKIVDDYRDPVSDQAPEPQVEPIEEVESIPVPEVPDTEEVEQ